MKDLSRLVISLVIGVILGASAWPIGGWWRYKQFTPTDAIWYVDAKSRPGGTGNKPFSFGKDRAFSSVEEAQRTLPDRHMRQERRVKPIRREDVSRTSAWLRADERQHVSGREMNVIYVIVDPQEN